MRARHLSDPPCSGCASPAAAPASPGRRSLSRHGRAGEAGEELSAAEKTKAPRGLPARPLRHGERRPEISVPGSRLRHHGHPPRVLSGLASIARRLLALEEPGCQERDGQHRQEAQQDDHADGAEDSFQRPQKPNVATIAASSSRTIIGISASLRPVHPLERPFLVLGLSQEKTKSVASMLAEYNEARKTPIRGQHNMTGPQGS